MAAHRIEIAPELIAEGKRLYEETLTPLREIAVLMGICRRTLENRIREWNWRRRPVAGRAIEPFPAVRGAATAAVTGDALPAGAANGPVLPQQRNEIAVRIQSVVEREIAAVEEVLQVLGPSDQAEAERTSRTLASLARTLRELAALNQPEQALPNEADDDPVPGDIDEFRRELARRIRGFIERRRAGADPFSDEPKGSLA